MKRDKSLIKFGADGIRGIAGKWPFDKSGIYQLANSLTGYVDAHFIHPYVVIGRDTRASGEWIVEVIKNELHKTGIRVIDLGILPTPAIAYTAKKERADLGLIVSASHNPREYNGIKLVDSQGLRLPRQAEIEIETFLRDPLPEKPARKRKQPGGRETARVKEAYIKDHIRLLGRNSLKGIRIVIDCANGAVSNTAPQVLGGTGAEIAVRNADLTGKRPINHNCGSEFVRRDPGKFAKLVQAENANYGLAFDGDGDRLVIVDKDGNFFNGDDLLFSLAKHFKQQRKLRGNAVVTTHLANEGLISGLRKLGIKAIKARNGDKNLEALIWGNNYLLGAEQVGNLIINDGMHGAADPLYAIGLLFKILIEQKRTFKDLTQGFEKHPQILISAHTANRISNQEINEIKHWAKTKPFINARLWYSSTERDLLNVLVEGRKNMGVADVREIAYELFQKIDSGVHHPRELVLSYSSLQDMPG